MENIIKYKNEYIEDILKDINKLDSNEDKLKVVKYILKEVKEEGDSALISFMEKFQKVKLKNFYLDYKEVEEAFNVVGKEFIEEIIKRKSNLEKYYKKEKIEEKDGHKEKSFLIGKKIVPLNRVGIYIDDKRKDFIEEILCNVILSKIAKVKEVILIAPPNIKGKLSPKVIVAGMLCGVDKILKLSGVCGIGALAYGSESVEKADKILGSGDIYAYLATKEVYDEVDCNFSFEKREFVIVSNENSNIKEISLELVREGGKDENSYVFLITENEEFALKVNKEIENEMDILSLDSKLKYKTRKNIKLIITEDIDESINLVNSIGPEVVHLMIKEDINYLDKIKNAGCILLSRYSIKDYLEYNSIINTLGPRGGKGRFKKQLSVEDFVKKIPYVYNLNKDE